MDTLEQTLNKTWTGGQRYTRHIFVKKIEFMGNDDALILNFEAPLPGWEEKAAAAIRSRRRFAIRDYIATLDSVRDCQKFHTCFLVMNFPGTPRARSSSLSFAYLA